MQEDLVAIIKGHLTAEVAPGESAEDEEKKKGKLEEKEAKAAANATKTKKKFIVVSSHGKRARRQQFVGPDLRGKRIGASFCCPEAHFAVAAGGCLLSLSILSFLCLAVLSSTSWRA